MKLIILLFTFIPLLSLACDKEGNSGFLPENDLWISADTKGLDMTEEKFSSIIDSVVKFYKPKFEELGVNFSVDKQWEEGAVNAYAQQVGNNWKIAMFGGLARHKETTEDGFALVVCHELGHHIGGAPKYNGMSWASNEGQADYWATLKCFRNYVQGDNNIEILANRKPGNEEFEERFKNIVVKECAKSFTNLEKQAICQRASLASFSLASLLGSLGGRVAFEKPSNMFKTFDGHPPAQCRLDTYLQGALCKVDQSDAVDRVYADIGTCNKTDEEISGVRPPCWYRP